MSISRQTLTFDRHGDVFLLLEGTHEVLTSGTRIDQAAAGDVPADDAPTENIAVNGNDVVEVSEHTYSTATDSSDTTAKREIGLRVSSKHLSLASTAFGDMFNRTSSKDLLPCDENVVTIPLPQYTLSLLAHKERELRRSPQSHQVDLPDNKR